jgi:hypothetical protein
MIFITSKRISFRGEGLGNELLPVGKALAAKRLLPSAFLVKHAWGLNRRGYRKLFNSSFFDWIFQALITFIFPVYIFDKSEFTTGNFYNDLALWLDKKKIRSKKIAVIQLEGMWGGYPAIAEVLPDIQEMLYKSHRASNNINDTIFSYPKDKIIVGIHIRQGDFSQPIPIDEYKNKFNVSIPLEWYDHVCTSLLTELEKSVQFVFFCDVFSDEIHALIKKFNGITPSQKYRADASDVLLLANCDLICCSISSFSLLAVALGKSPYLWFEHQLHCESGMCSIWGHEENHALEFDSSLNVGRGFPVRIDGVIDPMLLDYLNMISILRNPKTDLSLYGALLQR